MAHHQVARSVNGNGNGSYRRLIEACKRKDLSGIKSILAEQPELANQRDKQNRTLLHYAVILMLDDDDDDDNDVSPSPSSSSAPAKSTNETLHCLECFDYLTSRCDIKLWWQQDSDGLSVLHMAVISSNVPMVEHIIYEHPYAIKYPLVSMRDHEHHSPLHWAVITNNLDSVKLLINYAGTSLAHEPDLNGATPLHYATQTSDYPRYRQQLLGMLRSVGAGSGGHGGANLSKVVGGQENGVTTTTTTRDKESDPVQQVAGKQQVGHIGPHGRAVDSQRRRSFGSQAKQDGMSIFGGSIGGANNQPRSFEILEYLVRLPQINLECADRDQRTPLLWAASSGNCEAIELLLAHGANPLSCDANRLGGLHCAASHGYTDCLECLLLEPATQHQQQQQPDVNYQMRPNVDPNQVDNLNCTPLFYGVLSGNVDCVETLLDHGAHCDWQDSKGRTAAHFAALKGQLGAMKLLQERGANLWLANKQGDLPLHYAIKSGRLQVVRWLLEHSPYERAVNAINNFGRAPIHLAIMRNNVQLVEYLIRCGANLNQLVKMRTKQSTSSQTHTKAKSEEDQTGCGTMDSAVQQQQQSQVSGRGNGKSTIIYHYETAVDMAKRLGNNECLLLLEENQAKPASQVITSRQQLQQQRLAGGPNDSAGRSLFEIQSVEGPSPIGFETSCSSASPNTASQSTKTPAGTIMAASEVGGALSKHVMGEGSGSKVPKLRRPAPDSLPCTDSTASSALSQNSLTSVRGTTNKQQATEQNKRSKREDRPEVGCCDDERCAKDKGGPHDDHDPAKGGCAVGDSRGRGSAASARPYRGGISYNNEHICASIKCKLYDINTSSQKRCSGCSTARGSMGDWQLPVEDVGGQQQGARAPPHSAPAVRTCWRPGGQEIVTNVNVYTSPCTHCMLANQTQLVERRKCQECFGGDGDGHRPSRTSARQQAPRHSTTSMGAQQQQQQHYMTGDKACSADDETTDGPSGGSDDGGGGDNDDDDDNGLDYDQSHGDRSSRLPSLVSSAAPSQQQGFVRLKYLPPSQGHEQHLPVIMSDREHSTSATSNEQAEGDDEKDEDEEDDGQIQGEEAGYNKGAPTSRRQMVSPAFEEPRFDKSQQPQHQQVTASSSAAATTRATARSHDRYIHQVRSPVAEYIRGSGGPPPAATQQGPFHRPEVATIHRGGKRLNGPQPAPVRPRASSNQRMPDFSQVRPKVDSNRLPLDYQEEPPRSKSMSMLSHQQDDLPRRLSTTTTAASPMHQYHHKSAQQPPPAHRGDPAGGSRSVSRQTIIRTRRLSVDSVELATRVEKAIRKYRFETKLFEELQNLKRSQIRSGRANEALLVKRLVEHLRQDTRDLIGLDSYSGPYTYKAYERFLYDQLRKLSQSNCAKLSRHQPPYRNLVEGDDHLPPPPPPNEVDGDDDELMMINHQFLDDDLRADMELRQIIGNQEGEEMDHHHEPLETTSQQGEPHDGMDDSDTVESFVLEPSGALEEIRVRGDVFGDGERKLREHDAGAEPNRKEVMQIIHSTSGGDDDDDGEFSPMIDQKDGRGSLELTHHTKEIESQTQEMTPGNIEEEAKSMSSAIIVDVLGNVSRVGSMNDLNRLSGEQAGDRVRAEEMHSILQPKVETAKTTDEQQEAGGSVEPVSLLSEGAAGDVSQQQQQPKSRRRSIVNINNKMECIYHDVGIEIDPAPEMDAPEEDSMKEEAQRDEGQADGRVSQKEEEDEKENREAVNLRSTSDGAGSPIRRLADLAEEDQDHSPQQMDKPEPSMLSKRKVMIQDDGKQSGTAGVVDGGTSRSGTGERVDGGSEYSEHGHPETTSGISAASSVSRRASSPSAAGRVNSNRSSRRDPKRWSGGSSFTDTPPPPAPKQTNKTRVFNGHDPDALHRERSRSREASQTSKEKFDQATEELSSVELSEKTAGMEENSSQPDDNRLAEDYAELRQPDSSDSERVKQQEVERGASMDKLEKASTEEEEGRTVEEGSANDHQQQQQQPQQVDGGQRKRTTRRRRLARSRLKPASKYKPRVPSDDEIKQRWSQIKARERSKLALGRGVASSPESSTGGVGAEFVGNDNNNTRLTAHLGGDGAGLQAARSQPNLKGSGYAAAAAGSAQEILANQSTAELYTLLYEINEAMRGRSVVFADGKGDDEGKLGVKTAKGAGGKASTKHQWCQRMAAQIVDVRTVKRTLSLPEAVMYSNDLLKRFNILKL